jgi:hypothetical protein
VPPPEGDTVPPPYALQLGLLPFGISNIGLTVEQSDRFVTETRYVERAS